MKAQEEILKSLNQLRPLRVLVVGDLFLDSYLEGSIHRISPEAPVPILNVEQNFAKPGGAGNVALNLVAMGNEAVLLSSIGADLIGDQLISLLGAVETTALIRDSESKTGQKQRILSHQQQILRIDWEKIHPMSAQLEALLLQSATQLLPNVDIVALSDYGKGICTPTFTSALIELAKSFGRPVVVDPKGSDFERYSGAAIIKPNLAELHTAIDPSRKLTLDEAAEAVLSSCPAISQLLVTRSEQGMTLFSNGNRIDFPAHFVKINDVTGAGDTAFAMLAHSWGSGLHPDQCAQLANCAAGIAVQQLGCAQVSLAQIAKSVAHFPTSRKVVPELSPLALKALLQKEQALLITIDSEKMRLDHLLALIDLMGKIDDSRPAKVVLCCPNQDATSEILRIAKSLKGVDFLFLRQENQSALMALVEWSAIFNWKNGKFDSIDRQP